MNTIQWIELKGRWKSDTHNRLRFQVNKSNNRYDTITFQGDWQVKQNNVRYRFQKRSLRKTASKTHFITFKGYWEITRRNRVGGIG